MDFFTIIMASQEGKVSQTPGGSVLSTDSSSSRTLDLSRRNFTEIPEEISWSPNLEVPS